ncbi:MAG: hypothetical protein LBM02_09815 [Lachnospiraceae bacterium]|jgi:hypothetical protein|nr:hypothetical protein [Lachnospiraceae bacterium]
MKNDVLISKYNFYKLFDIRPYDDSDSFVIQKLQIRYYWYYNELIVYREHFNIKFSKEKMTLGDVKRFIAYVNTAEFSHFVKNIDINKDNTDSVNGYIFSKDNEIKEVHIKCDFDTNQLSYNHYDKDCIQDISIKFCKTYNNIITAHDVVKFCEFVTKIV